MRKRTHTRLTHIYRSLYFPPVVIAIAILAATGVTWRSSRLSLHHDLESAVNSRTTATEQSIRTTMNSYEEILRGGVGLFQGSNEVTRQDFSRYLQAFDVHKNFPSVQAIGYNWIIRQDQLPEATSYMQSQGLNSFQVHPVTPPRDTYAAVSYVESVAFKGTPNYGYDMYSDVVRRTALYRARDTGSTAITGPLRSVFDKQNPSQTTVGFNIYSPYYASDVPITNAAERQAALRGYLFAAFRAERFFSSIAHAAGNNTAAFRVDVANQANGELYRSDNFDKIVKQQNTVKVSRTMPLYGETWIIQYVFNRQGLVSDIQLRRPASVLFAGIFTSGLIGLVVLLLLRSRAQELAAQKEQAVELAKDELLSLASHQLRTPATGVKQYVGMVLQGFAGAVPREQKSLLEKAYASNDRQLSVINEILHLAKIDSGRIVLARQPTDLGSLVEDIVSEQQPDITAAHHTMVLRLPKRPIVLDVDPHTLRMAIENLLSNAIKYTPEGGEIAIRVRRDERVAYIRVKDSGIGIAGNDLDKLFKQFSRLPNEMSLRVGGTGIGLYLAKHLVELHGGHITVTSSPGNGSLFTIILPLQATEK